MNLFLVWFIRCSIIIALATMIQYLVFIAESARVRNYIVKEMEKHNENKKMDKILDDIIGEDR